MAKKSISERLKIDKINKHIVSALQLIKILCGLNELSSSSFGRQYNIFNPKNTLLFFNYRYRKLLVATIPWYLSE